MKKNIIAIIWFLFITFWLSSCFNGEEIQKEDNNKVQHEEPINKEISKKEYNKEWKHIEPVIKVKSKSDKKLAQIEAEIQEENKKIEQEKKEKIEKVKNTIRDYFSRVNSDKDIIDLVDEKSIDKIRTNTREIYKLFTDEEKKKFIKELRDYGFLKETFNPDNNDDLYKYINFVIKAWYRNLWNNQPIKKVEFSNFTEIVDKETWETIYFMQVTLTFKDNNVKKVKLFLNKDFKIIIAN